MKIYILLARMVTLCWLVSIGVLQGCGGGGGSTQNPSTDVVNPTVTFTFPTKKYFTTDYYVRVSGAAGDDRELSNVTVNGADATSSDGFTTWYAYVDIAPGINTLAAKASDRAGNVSTVTVELERVTDFNEVKYIGYDTNSRRLLLPDSNMSALVAFDSASPVTNILSAAHIPDNTNAFSYFKAIDVDSGNNRALLADNFSLDRLLDVDLVTGARRVITQDTLVAPLHTLYEPHFIEIDSTNNFAYVLDSRPSGGFNLSIKRFNLTTGEATAFYDNPAVWANGIALDLAHNRILVSDAFPRAVYAIDLTTRIRTVLSDNSTPDNNNQIIDPIAVTLDPTNNRALILDARDKRLLGINLDTGARTVLATGLSQLTALNVFTPAYMKVDSANRVLIADSSSALNAVNLGTGVLSVLSNNTTPDANNPFSGINGLTLDITNNRALVTSSINDSIIAVNLTNGTRTILSNSVIPDGVNPFDTSTGIALDTANNRALALDSGHDAILSVKLTNGGRTIFSDSLAPDANNTFNQISALAHDLENNRLLVLDQNRKAMVGVDVRTGVRTVVSDAYTPSKSNMFSHPIDVVMQGSTAWVLDDYLGTIFSVNLGSGSRTILSAPDIPNNTNALSTPIHMVLDNARLLVINNAGASPAIMAVNLADGSRSILSDNTTPNNRTAFIQPKDITLDAVNNRALVLDKVIKRIVAVDLNSGARTLVAGGLPNSAVPLFRPNDITLDIANNRALVVNGNVLASSLYYEGLIAVDLATGARSLISDNTTPDANNPFTTPPRGVALDSANSRALVLTETSLYGVNLSTGARTLIASGFANAKKLAFDSANNRVLITRGNAVYATHLGTGVTTVFSDNTTPDATNPLASPSAIAIDNVNNRALVLNSGSPHSLVSIHLNTGARNLISDDSIPEINNQIGSAHDMVYDSTNNRVLVADGSHIIAIHLTTGARSQVNGRFHNSYAIELSPMANQVLLLDWERGIQVLDTVSGENLIFSR